MATLEGNHGLRRIRTSGGTLWCVSRDGRYAWPLFGKATAFGPYDTDVARARGMEVDVNMNQQSYAVTNAGPAWREVYDILRSEKPSQV